MMRLLRSALPALVALFDTTGIILNNTTNNIPIGDGLVAKGSSAASGCAIQIATGVDKVTVGTIRNDGMAKGLCDAGTTANKAIGTVLNW